MKNKRRFGLVLMAAFAFLLTGIISVKAEAQTVYVQASSKSYIKYDDGFRLSSESKSTYDKKGNRVSMEDTWYDYYDPSTFSYVDTPKKTISKYKYTYNSAGQVTKTTVNGKKSSVNKYKGGKLVKSQSYSDGKLYSTTTYTYKNGKRTKAVTKRTDGSTEITYDKHENPVKSVSYKGTGKNKVKYYESTQKYTYKKGFVSKETYTSKSYTDGKLSSVNKNCFVFYTSGYQKGWIKTNTYEYEGYDLTTGNVVYSGDSSEVCEYKADKTKKNVAECITKDGKTGEVTSKSEYTYKKVNK